MSGKSEGMKSRRRSSSRLSRRGTRGAILLEYAFLLTAVGLPVVLGIFAAGMQMLKNYHDARDTVLDSSAP